MAETLIVNGNKLPELIVTLDINTDGLPQDAQEAGIFSDLLVPAPPQGLNAEQLSFWRWFPPKVTSLGELRRKIGLTRREWYYPPDNLRYHKLANLSDHLKKEPERVKQLLEDDQAFLAYVATLRLQGA